MSRELDMIDDARAHTGSPLDVRGEIEAVAWRDGSSGRWTGSISGLYDGWRTGTPPVQVSEFVAAHGSLGLSLEQDGQDQLPERSLPNPLADGASITSLDRAVPDPEGKRLLMPYCGTRQNRIVLRVDPDTSSGIYAGATGEVVLAAPHHREAGHVVVTTPVGDLRMTFLEHWGEGVITAELVVDGAGSSGQWLGATGEVSFCLQLYMIGLAHGTYEGAITLRNPVDSATA